jgi:hypothetical protein
MYVHLTAGFGQIQRTRRRLPAADRPTTACSFIPSYVSLDGNAKQSVVSLLQ